MINDEFIQIKIIEILTKYTDGIKILQLQNAIEHYFPQCSIAQTKEILMKLQRMQKITFRDMFVELSE